MILCFCLTAFIVLAFQKFRHFESLRLSYTFLLKYLVWFISSGALLQSYGIILFIVPLQHVIMSFPNISINGSNLIYV